MVPPAAIIAFFSGELHGALQDQQAGRIDRPDGSEEPLGMEMRR
jgi:hypothetical protein